MLASGQRVPAARLSAFYFFYFGALGALVPYLSPYLAHLGFGPRAMGSLMAILFSTRILAPVLAGWLSDRLGRRMALVRASCLVTAIAFAGMFLSQSYGWIALILAICGFTWAASLPPLEAVTLNHLGDQFRRYGRIRLWGSIGFIATVLLLGEAFERVGLGLLLPVVTGLFGAIALAALVIPDRASPGETDGGPTFVSVLRSPGVGVLLTLSVVMVASHGPYYTFFSIYLAEQGYRNLLIGGLWALGVLAEILIFVFSSRLLSRFPLRTLLVVTLLMTSTRWLILGTAISILPLVILAQCLHAFSFGLFHALSIHVIHAVFVGRTQSRGQAIYASLSWGLGGGLGSLAAGELWARLGPTNTFLLAAALPLAGAILASLWFPAEGGHPDGPRA